MIVRHDATRRSRPSRHTYPRTAAAEQEEFRRAGWRLFRAMAFCKIVIMCSLIVVAASRVDHNGPGLGTILFLNWFWLVPLMLFGSVPAWYRLRLYRMRRRRAALIRAEWHVER